MINIIKPEFLGNRLDADFYKQDFIDNELILNNFGSVSLNSLIDIKKSGYGALPKSDEYLDNGLPLIRGGDLSYGYIQEIGVFVPKYYKDSRAIAKTGDILILIKGACIDGPEGVARVSECENGYLYNGSCYRLSFKNKDLDGRFFIAYSQTKFFLKQKSRHIANTGISYNDENSILNYLIPNFSINIKKYIGDKVSQAEILRLFAKSYISKAENIFIDSIHWSSEILNVSKIGKLKPDELENRLDLKYNSPQRLAILRHIKKSSFKTAPLNELVEISAMVGWKGLTTEFYRKSGPWLLRGVEFNNGVIDFEKLVSIDREKFIEQPQIHLEKGDIAFSKDGTIGKAVVIPELNNDLAAGSTIARLRIKKHLGLNPYYLDFVLNHQIVNTQVESFATGVAQPHITQEWIAQLIIPLIESQEVVGELVRVHHRSQWFSKILLSISKFLVEGLINGSITEDELIQAQNALEQGDNSLDRAILSKMTEDGYAVAGSKPLFADLDEFYELLEQAKEFE